MVSCIKRWPVQVWPHPLSNESCDQSGEITDEWMIFSHYSPLMVSITVNTTHSSQSVLRYIDRSLSRWGLRPSIRPWNEVQPGAVVNWSGSSQHCLSCYQDLQAAAESLILGLKPVSQISSGNLHRKFIPRLRTQAGVGDRGLRGSRTEWRLVTGRLAGCVSELLVDSGVLGHIGGGGGVKEETQDDDEERQQVEAWELKQRHRLRLLEWWNQWSEDFFTLTLETVVPQIKSKTWFKKKKCDAFWFVNFL